MRDKSGQRYRYGSEESDPWKDPGKGSSKALATPARTNSDDGTPLVVINGIEGR